MKRHLKKYFIPHRDNDHKPHFLREASVAVTTLIIVALFLASFVHVSLILSNRDFIAAILPAVLVDLTNEERQDNRLGELRRNSTLDRAAQLKANDMAEKGYFAHNSPGGETPWDWIYASGYQFRAAGENLAVNFSDSDQVVRAWMESPGHRSNILNGGFNEIGMATAKGTYKGKETIFVVQMFGTPLSLASASDDVAGTQTNVGEEEVSGEEALEVEVSSQGPIAEEESEEEGVARADVERLEVTDVVEQNDSLYIAVRDPSAEEESQTSPADAEEEEDDEVATTSGDVSTSSPVLATTDGVDAPQYSSFLERMASRPNMVLNILYLLLGTLIAISIVLNVGIEAQKQHKMGVAYGILELVLIIALAVLNQSLLFSNIVIV